MNSPNSFNHEVNSDLSDYNTRQQKIESAGTQGSNFSSRPITKVNQNLGLVTEELTTPESQELRLRRGVSEMIRTLSTQEMDYAGEVAMRPKAEIICDHDHIEDQRIDAIFKKDKGAVELSFKLRRPTKIQVEKQDKTEQSLGVFVTSSGAILKKGKITYGEAFADDLYTLCDAYILEGKGIKVFIANPTSRDDNRTTKILNYSNKSGLIRTAIGLIRVEIPADMDPEMAERILEEILEKDFDIPNALGEVSEEAEREYKVSRYKWQHVITDEPTPEQAARAARMERQEVFPGYTTFVEKGRHKEYLGKYGEGIRAVHELRRDDSPEAIYQLLTRGYMCLSERHSRGIATNRMAATHDIDSGGADNVFCRITNETQRRSMDRVSLVVFKPEVFDRTDWYSYYADEYGSTDSYYFTKRLSPDATFALTTVAQYDDCPNNELMFRTGIGANFIESIEVDSTSKRDEIIIKLRSMGLEEVDERPIEDIIVLRQPAPQISIEEFAAKKQEKMQNLIDGKDSYTSFYEICDLAFYGSSLLDSLKSMIESIINHGEKARLASDVAEYFRSEYCTDELKALSTEGVHAFYSANYWINEEEKLVEHLQSTLDIDFQTIYEKARRLAPPDRLVDIVDEDGRTIKL